jgi:omega-amidase
LKIYGLQWDIFWEDKPANFSRVQKLLAENPPAPGSMIVLPEMFSTGFSHDQNATNEPDHGPTRGFLTEIAQKYDVCALGGRVCESKNEALAIGPAMETLVRYAKIKPFRPGGEIYSPGIETVVCKWDSAKICPFICYDLRFPELFREAMRKDCPDVFVVIASWPKTRISHWLALLQTRAIENQAFVIGVNRTGTDPDFSYPGRSVVFDYSGECLADAGSVEGTFCVSLDLAGLREYRKKLPFLEDFV